jgi:hypothetical protein
MKLTRLKPGAGEPVSTRPPELPILTPSPLAQVDGWVMKPPFAFVLFPIAVTTPVPVVIPWTVVELYQSVSWPALGVPWIAAPLPPPLTDAPGHTPVLVVTAPLELAHRNPAVVNWGTSNPVDVPDGGGYIVWAKDGCDARRAPKIQAAHMELNLIALPQ